MTTRDDIVRLLQAEKPDADFADDEAMYQQILCDYEDYARLLTAHHEQLDREEQYKQNIEASMLRLSERYAEDELNAATVFLKKVTEEVSQGIYSNETVEKIIHALSIPVTDGLPHLGNASPVASPFTTSIFDLAREA